LFREPPSGKYEYCNPCRYVRSETGVYSDVRYRSDDSDSDGYEKVSSSLSARSRPKPSSKPVAPRVPVKKGRSSENDNKQNPETAENFKKRETIKSCPDQSPDLIHDAKAKNSSTSGPLSSTSRLMGDKNADEFIYEELDSIADLGVKAVGETTKRTQDSDDTSKTPRPQHQVHQQYAIPHARAAPGKKQPPPTKPKSFKHGRTASSSATTVCRVNPLKPSVSSAVPLPGQSSASSGRETKHWKSAFDVPADLETLSVEQVGECMQLLHLPKLAAAFKSHDVDGKLLVNIVSEEVLVADFECRVFDAKKVVQFVKNGWRPN